MSNQLPLHPAALLYVRTLGTWQHGVFSQAALQHGMFEYRLLFRLLQLSMEHGVVIVQQSCHSLWQCLSRTTQTRPHCNVLILLHTAGQAAHSRNQTPGRASRQKESYKADWSQRQPQPGSADPALGAESSDFDTHLQKPVLQGRAKEIKEQLR